MQFTDPANCLDTKILIRPDFERIEFEINQIQVMKAIWKASIGVIVKSTNKIYRATCVALSKKRASAIAADKILAALAADGVVLLS